MTFKVSIPSGFALSWESQVRQYPAKGKPGIGYFPGPTPHGVVDCLLYRNVRGEVVGILNHYGFNSPYEKIGNVNVWVHPDHQRRGIATRLVKAAAERWTINAEQQRFTPEGAALAEKLSRDGTM